MLDICSAVFWEMPELTVFLVAVRKYPKSVQWRKGWFWCVYEVYFTGSQVKCMVLHQWRYFGRWAEKLVSPASLLIPEVDGQPVPQDYLL